MRILRIVTASTLLAGTALVVPVVTVGASPHAVAPSVDRVAFAPGRAVAAASTEGTAGTAGDPGRHRRDTAATPPRRHPSVRAC